MTVRERLTLPRLDDKVVDPGLLGAQIPGREARLLAVGETVLRRHVVHVAEVLLGVAHARDRTRGREWGRSPR